MEAASHSHNAHHEMPTEGASLTGVAIPGEMESELVDDDGEDGGHTSAAAMTAQSGDQDPTAMPHEAEAH